MLAFQASASGSIPDRCIVVLAQLGERKTEDLKVTGSIPVDDSTNLKTKN
jgi:hypothetical protein